MEEWKGKVFDGWNGWLKGQMEMGKGGMITSKLRYFTIFLIYLLIHITIFNANNALGLFYWSYCTPTFCLIILSPYQSKIAPICLFKQSHFPTKYSFFDHFSPTFWYHHFSAQQINIYLLKSSSTNPNPNTLPWVTRGSKRPRRRPGGESLSPFSNQTTLVPGIWTIKPFTMHWKYYENLIQKFIQISLGKMKCKKLGELKLFYKLRKNEIII
jgi:hypothetical protein